MNGRMIGNDRRKYRKSNAIIFLCKRNINTNWMGIRLLNESGKVAGKHKGDN